MTTDNATSRSNERGGAHPARVYDYFIGGENCLEADRTAGAWIHMRAPDLPAAMRANRAFLSRAVRWLTRQGLDQFIDIGSGFPVSPNTHEIALSTFPSGFVVYCDLDPAVGQRTRAAIAGQAGTAFVEGNIEEPEKLLTQPAIQNLIHSGRPVACVLAAVLHFVPEEADPDRITAILREALPRGSYLVISHVAGDFPWGNRNNEETLKRALTDMYPRTRERVADFFGEFEIVAPGVVPASQWNITEQMAGSEPHAAIYCGVARKT